MFQNTLHIFVARFTEALLKSMECKLKTEPLENIMYCTEQTVHRSHHYIPTISSIFLTTEFFLS